MLRRALAAVLLVAALATTAAPLAAAALNASARCCHTAACPMMKRGAPMRWTTCAPDADALRRSVPPATLAVVAGFARAPRRAVRFEASRLSPPIGVAVTVDHPPRSFSA